MTTSIGIRELRQNASKYIARVRRGESIEITERGRPVAILAPAAAPHESAWDRLVRLGIVTPAESAGGVAGIEPLPPEPGQASLSEFLREMRDDERF